MTKEEKLNALEVRLKKIQSRPDAMKTPGVIKKLTSKIKTLKAELNK